MNSANVELEKNGIKVICPVSQYNVTQIASYVANHLYARFPTLRISYNILYNEIVHIPMYIADMPRGMSDACYFYKNSSIYFRKGLNFTTVQRLAFHECIHHFQEVKDSKGELKKLGLCTYSRGRAFGNSLNEAAVQFMSSYGTFEKRDVVKYYDVTLPTDSPSYYPLLVNLVKQISYLTGYAVLFESTFYANDAFFNKFKELFGVKDAYEIQESFDKILEFEEKVIRASNKLQVKDYTAKKVQKINKEINFNKRCIKEQFFLTQDLIFSSYFDKRLSSVKTEADINEYRKALYNYSNLIGSTVDYSYFNEYYIDKMAELDRIYDKITNQTALVKVPNGLAGPSKVGRFMRAIKRLFGLGRQAEYYKNEE
jgi:hypothetical protein